MNFLSSFASRRLTKARYFASATPRLASAVPQGTELRTDFGASSSTTPRLPIPSLSSTLSRYLLSIQPHLSASELERESEIATSFLDGEVGKRLHASLSGRDADCALSGGYPFSYIESYWDDMYMCGRWSLPVNSNPFYMLNDGVHADEKGFEKAASLTKRLVQWGFDLRANGLQDDGGCMKPYPLMMGTGRIPMRGRDELRSGSKAGHVVVLRGGRAYKVTVVGPHGVRDARAVERAFEEIAGRPVEGGGGFPGWGTALGRDEWAELRDELGNKESFRAIDEAQFVICLDDEQSMTEDEESVAMLQQADNRWYDKHQLVRLGNGKLGFNWEHSFSDGMIWNRCIEDCEAGSDEGAEGECEIEEIGWELDAQQMEKLGRAGEKVKEELCACENRHLNFQDFGKAEFKTWKVSPDAAVQMSYQLAFHGIHGSMPPVYESCATRNFHRGRTETIRTCTNESKAFVDAFNCASSDDFKREAFLKACGKHVEVAKEAKMGQGVDRIFLALEKEAEREGVDVELFKSDVYLSSKSWKLSTSNVSHPSLSRFGFGPVVGDGYGLGYLIGNDGFSVNVTNFKGGGTDGKAMRQGIGDSVRKIKSIF